MSIIGKIINYKGCYCIIVNNSIILNYINNKFKIPENFKLNKVKRDGIDSYHITVITSNENKKMKCNEYLDNIIKTSENFEIDILGLGFNSECYYIVCVSSNLDNLRKKLSLESKDFHITLGYAFSDKHDISKSIDTLIDKSPIIIEKVIKNLSLDLNKNIKLLVELEQIYPDNIIVKKNLINKYSKNSNYSMAMNISKQLVNLNPDNILGYYSVIKLMIKTDSYDLELLKYYITSLLKINNIKQNKFAIEIVIIINELSIKYKFIKFVNESKTNIKFFSLLSFNNDEKKIIEIHLTKIII